jgi:hypothetical protein
MTHVGKNIRVAFLNYYLSPNGKRSPLINSGDAFYQGLFKKNSLCL